MHKTEKPLLSVLQGKVPEHSPIWLMRQAGRYLPEYRALRSKAENFLNLCLTPEWATEITLQPIRRFDFDAAILFADILLIPMALGMRLEFREGEGPVLDKAENEKAIDTLHYQGDRLLPVYETLRRVKKDLPEKTTLIGFCGAPWTVACYMIDGNSKTAFSITKEWTKKSPNLLDKLLAKLVDASEVYLTQQIEAGAEVLQIFDSWSGLLQASEFERWIIKPTQELVKRLKASYPHIPIIGFPRAAKPQDYKAYAQQIRVDGVSIDYDITLDFAKNQLQPLKPLQGNLDPALLVKGGTAMINSTEQILQSLGSQHIFNLGHGVVPQTPPEHVGELVKFVHGYTHS